MNQYRYTSAVHALMRARRDSSLGDARDAMGSLVEAQEHISAWLRDIRDQRARTETEVPPWEKKSLTLVPRN